MSGRKILKFPHCVVLTSKKWWDFWATWSAIFTSTESKYWANLSWVGLPWSSIWEDKSSLLLWNKNGKICEKVSAFFKSKFGSRNMEGTWDKLSTVTEDLKHEPKNASNYFSEKSNTNPQCGNYRNLLSHFFDKNSWK